MWNFCIWHKTNIYSLNFHRRCPITLNKNFVGKGDSGAVGVQTSDWRGTCPGCPLLLHPLKPPFGHQHSLYWCCTSLLPILIEDLKYCSSSNTAVLSVLWYYQCRCYSAFVQNFSLLILYEILTWLVLVFLRVSCTNRQTKNSVPIFNTSSCADAEGPRDVPHIRKNRLLSKIQTVDTTVTTPTWENSIIPSLILHTVN